MANFRSLPFSIVLLLLLASLIMANSDGGSGESQQEEVSLLEKCRSLDPCRGNHSNKECCNAIEGGIGSLGCSCVCKRLIEFGAINLTTKCSKSWCANCEHCHCSTKHNQCHHCSTKR